MRCRALRIFQKDPIDFGDFVRYGNELETRKGRNLLICYEDRWRLRQLQSMRSPSSEWPRSRAAIACPKLIRGCECPAPRIRDVSRI